jgi:serine/threonine protein kinase
MSAEPRRLGKYELQTLLASGGMGEVWKALDTQLQRYVAIKLLLADRQQDPDFVSRFELEARLIAALRHPNIVKIHDFAAVQDTSSDVTTAYMVMDYVEGQTLGSYIRQTSRQSHFPSASDLVYLFTGMSRAIDYAHQQGMIHRDIKPDNILLDQRPPQPRSMGTPILTDFGIARVQSVSSGTMLGTLLGTPLYMAPEQAQGQYDNPRSDLYSLGIILYEMTTGITPFRGDTALAILVQHMHDEPTSPSLINPNVTPALSAVILKSIAKDPQARFESATAMTLALAEALGISLLPNLNPSPTSAFSRPLTPPPPIAQPTYSAQPSPPAFVSSPGPYAFSSAPTTSPATTPIPLMASPQPASSAPHLSKWYLFTALAVLLALLGGVAWFVHTSQPPLTPTTVGTIYFSSTQAAPGSYNTLQITLHNIPDPPSNHAYYAWIEIPGREGNLPHWRLTVQQGTVQMSSLTYPGYPTLLVPQSLFLITEEVDNPPPVIPFPDPSARLYYAAIPNTTTTTLTVTACPQNTSSNVCTS